MIEQKPRDHQSDLEKRKELALHIQQGKKETAVEVREAEVKFTEELPKLVVLGSDYHLGSAYTNEQLIDEITGYVSETPGVGIIHLGDLIEGFNPAYVNTNVIGQTMPLHFQILDFKDRYIDPLADKGKLIAMVSAFSDSHELWLSRQTGLDPYAIFAYKTNVPVVGNGGILKLKFTNGNEIAIRMLHNAKSGRETNPAGGVKRSDKQLTGYVDAVVAGHLHTLGPAVLVNKDTKGDLLAAIQLGAFKGLETGDSLPDPFMVQRTGGKLSGPPGSSALLYQLDGEWKLYPVADLNLAKLLFEAATLRYLTDQSGKTPEVLREYETKNEPDRNTVIESRSTHKKSDDKDAAASYGALFREIKTKMPQLIFFIGGYRAGSKNADRESLKQIVDLVSATPHAHILLLRQMIDQGVEKQVNRQRTVENYIEVLRPAWSKGKVIAHLYDGILRYEDWKKPKVRSERGFEDPKGFMAATHITEKTSIPLVDNLGTVTLALRTNGRNSGSTYTVRLFDRTAGRGSRENPSSALFSLESADGYNAESEQHDVLAGGDDVRAEWQTRFEPKDRYFQTAIAPGWNAHEHSKGGKGNRSPASREGLGVILLPDGRGVIPFSTVEEGTWLHQTMLNYYAAAQLGLISSLTNPGE